MPHSRQYLHDHGVRLRHRQSLSITSFRDNGMKNYRTPHLTFIQIQIFAIKTYSIEATIRFTIATAER